MSPALPYIYATDGPTTVSADESLPRVMFRLLPNETPINPEVINNALRTTANSNRQSTGVPVHEPGCIRR